MKRKKRWSEASDKKTKKEGRKTGKRRRRLKEGERKRGRMTWMFPSWISVSDQTIRIFHFFSLIFGKAFFKLPFRFFGSSLLGFFFYPPQYSILFLFISN